MTWRGVVFNANNIVGKLLGRGVGGRDVFKYLELNWHMRLCHAQLCWPLVCGCWRLTSLKAGTGVWGLALL
jgi:hypothetical protein